MSNTFFQGGGKNLGRLLPTASLVTGLIISDLAAKRLR